jgi:hypothetical protein
MILSKNKTETDSFLDINNDITRIMNALNKNQALKRMLVYTDTKPLENPVDVEKDLRDKQISRVPILPYNEDEGSIIVISFLSGELDTNTTTMNSTIAIDIFTPGNQWIMNEGIRPLQIAHIVSNIMRKDLIQTGGVKYRLASVINAQLSDILVGYRLIFDTVIDD